MTAIFNRAAKARRAAGARRQAGFTLVELIVVIGLMALLGTISTTGYMAATHGMAENGAVESVKALLKQAFQTSVIEYRKTAVIFYNEPVGDEYRGVALAVRSAGRVTSLANGKLVDEFADWQRSFPTAGDSAAGKGDNVHRIFLMEKLRSGLYNCCSQMNPYIESVTPDAEYLADLDVALTAGGVENLDGVDDIVKSSLMQEKIARLGSLSGITARWGLGFAPGNRGQGIGAWNVGAEYGVELAAVSLPPGYWFNVRPGGGSQIQDAGSPVVFEPSSSNQAFDYSSGTLPKIVSERNPSGIQITKAMLNEN